MHIPEPSRIGHRHGPKQCGWFHNYYEITQINIDKSGNYTVACLVGFEHHGSSISGECNIYEENYNTFNGVKTKFFDLSGVLSFSLCSIQTTTLQVNRTYLLVINIPEEKRKDTYSIVVSGPSNMTFSRIREYPIHHYKSIIYFLVLLSTITRSSKIIFININKRYSYVSTSMSRWTVSL